MTNDSFLGGVVGAGITLMVADRILRPRYKASYKRKVKRRKKR